MTQVAANPLERQFARFAQLHAEVPAPRARADYPGATSYYDVTYARWLDSGRWFWTSTSRVVQVRTRCWSGSTVGVGKAGLARWAMRWSLKR